MYKVIFYPIFSSALSAILKGSGNNWKLLTRRITFKGNCLCMNRRFTMYFCIYTRQAIDIPSWDPAHGPSFSGFFSDMGGASAAARISSFLRAEINPHVFTELLPFFPDQSLRAQTFFLQTLIAFLQSAENWQLPESFILSCAEYALLTYTEHDTRSIQNYALTILEYVYTKLEDPLYKKKILQSFATENCALHNFPMRVLSSICLILSRYKKVLPQAKLYQCKNLYKIEEC